VSGVYDFYGSADDGMSFMLSTDSDPANLREILREPTWNASRDYNGTTRRTAGALENWSRTLFPDGIALEAGQQYGFAAREIGSAPPIS
jgi:hypothetical protein